MRQVEVVDPLTIRFYLKEPWPDFMTSYGTTATAAGLVAPKKYVTQVGNKESPNHLTGGGPNPSATNQPATGSSQQTKEVTASTAPKADGHQERARRRHPRHQPAEEGADDHPPPARGTPPTNGGPTPAPTSPLHAPLYPVERTQRSKPPKPRGDTRGRPSPPHPPQPKGQ